MKTLTEMALSDFPGLSYPCKCGHTAPIRRFLNNEGLLGGCASELASRFYPGGKE